MSAAHLLKLAFPLVRTHGFTRDSLARSVLALPTPHEEPLSDAAVSSLFGGGNDARRTLIKAWLEDGVRKMKTVPSPTMRTVLHARLEYNEPVLQYLSEAFAILVTPTQSILPIDVLPVMKHAVRIADETCYLTGDRSTELSWYTQRMSLATVYTAAELHQLTSPKTAHAFLDSLLDTSVTLKSSLDDARIFSSYIAKSWVGIIKSSGVL